MRSHTRMKSAFFFERTTAPSWSSRCSRNTSTSSPSLSERASLNSSIGTAPSDLKPTSRMTAVSELYEGTLSNIEEGEIVKSKVLRVTDTAVEDDGGVGHAQYLRFDDLAFFDIGERSLVQLRHLRDFVRRILFVQVGADAEVGVSGSGGGSFGLRLGRVFRIYQHSGHRFGCGFGPMGPGTIPGLRNTSSQT